MMISKTVFHTGVHDTLAELSLNLMAEASAIENDATDPSDTYRFP